MAAHHHRRFYHLDLYLIDQDISLIPTHNDLVEQMQKAVKDRNVLSVEWIVDGGNLKQLRFTIDNSAADPEFNRSEIRQSFPYLNISTINALRQFE